MGHRRLATVLVLVLLATSALPTPAATSTDPVDVTGSTGIAADGRFTGAGTASDPWTLSGLTLDLPNETVVTLRDVKGHVRLEDLTVSGRVLVDAADVEHLVIDGLTGIATGSGLVLRNIGTLTLEDVNVTARDTGVIVTGGDVTVRGVAVHDAGDGLVVRQATLDVEDLALAVAGNAVLLANTTANLRSVSTLGALLGGCSGTGVTATGGGRLNLSLSAIHCRGTGVRIDGLVAAGLSANLIQGAGTGVRITGTRTVLAGDAIIAHAHTGVRIDDAAVQLDDVVVASQGDGVRARDSILLVHGGTFTGADGAALRLTGGRLTSTTLAVVDSRTGIRLDGSDAVLGTDNDTVLRAVETGIRATGGNLTVDHALRIENGFGRGTGLHLEGVGTPGGGIEHLALDGVHRGMLLDVGVDLHVTTLDVDGTGSWTGEVLNGSRLTVDGGTWGERADVGGGFRLRDGGHLTTRNLTIGTMELPFIDAEDATVSGHDSTIERITNGGGVVAVETHLRLDGITLERTGATGIRVEGGPVPVDGNRTATALHDVTVGRTDEGHGVHLQGAILNATGSRFHRAAGHGLLAEGGSAFLLTDVHVTRSGRDGVRWTGLAALPASDLFPMDGDRGVEVVDTHLTGNAGDGLRAMNVGEGVGFRLENVSAYRNGGAGANFTDAHVLIDVSLFGTLYESSPYVSQFCFPECEAPFDYGNEGPGVRSVWTNASADERFAVLDSEFRYNQNHVLLHGHGETTLITGSTFARAITCGGDCQDPYDSIGAHSIHLTGGDRGLGPLVHTNTFLAGGRCHVLANDTRVRVVENIFSDPEYKDTCAVGLVDVSDFDVLGNDVDGAWAAFAVTRSSGRIIGNTVRDVYDAAVMVHGSGSETVIVGDNTFLNRTHGGYFRFGLIDEGIEQCGGGVVAWCNAQGVVAYNTIHGGPTTGLTVETAVYVGEGPGVPEVHHNHVKGSIGFHVVRDAWWTENPAAAYYEADHLLHDNTFEGYTNTDTAIDDQHGFSPSAGTHHPASLGILAGGNSYVGGHRVACHRDSDGNLLPGYPCNWMSWDNPGQEGLMVDTHHYEPVGGDGVPGPREDPYEFSQGTRTRPILVVDPETGELEPPCAGFLLRPVSLDVDHVSERTYRLRATSHWDVVGPPNAEDVCDTVADIEWEFLVDGAVVGTGLGMEHTFPRDGLFNVTFRARLASQGYGLEGRLQERTAEEEIYTGDKPLITEFRSNRGNVFVSGVSVPGDVAWGAKVLYGRGVDAADGYLVVRVPGGVERRAFGDEPVVTFDPGIEFPAGFHVFLLTAEAYADGGRRVSDPAYDRVKLVPFPTSLTMFIDRGDTKVAIDRNPRDPWDESLTYEWEINPIDWKDEFESNTAGGFDGEAVFAAGVVLKVQSKGAGTVAPQGVFNLELDGGRWSAEAAGKVAGEGTVLLDDVVIQEIVILVEMEGDFYVYLLPTDVYPPIKSAAAVPVVGGIIDDIDRLVRIGLGLGVKGEGSVKFEPSAAQHCAVIDGWTCSGTVAIKPRITVVAKSEVGDFEAKAFGRGEVFFVADVPGPEHWVQHKESGIALTAGYEIKYGVFREQGTVVWNTKFQSPGEGFVESESTGWRVAPRDWTTGGAFDGTNDGDSVIVLANLTPDADPVVALDAYYRPLALYVQDDLAKPYPRSTEIALAYVDGNGAWQDGGRVTDNALVDVSPAAAAFGDQYDGAPVLLAWVRDTNATLAEGDPLTDGAGRTFEVVARVFDVEAGAFAGPEVELTMDDALDDDVHVVHDHGDYGDGDGYVVWRKNAAGLARATEADADAIWAARFDADTFTNDEPVLAFSTETAAARQYAYREGELWMLAQYTNGTIALRSSDLAGTETTHWWRTTGDVPLVADLQAYFVRPAVAWLLENASGSGNPDLMVTYQEANGTWTTELVVSQVALHELRWDPSSRVLRYVEASGDGSRITQVRRGDTWLPPEVLHEYQGDLSLTGARHSTGPRLAWVEAEIVETQGERTYEGENLETDGGAPASITVTRNVTDVALGARVLRFAQVSPVAVAAPLAEPARASMVHTDTVILADGTLEATFVLTNPSSEAIPAQVGALHGGPWNGTLTFLGNVTVPGLAPNGTAVVTVTTADPGPGATGWWHLVLGGDRMDAGFPALVRLAPEWRLDPATLRDEDGAVTIAVANVGARAGTTTVAAFGLDAATPVATTSVTLDAGGRANVTLHVPAAERPLVVVANVADDGTPVDQASWTGSGLVVPGPTATTAFLGTFPASAGTYALNVDLARLAGVGAVKGVYLDGVPLDVGSVGSRLQASVTLTACPHGLEVDLDDLAGGVRRVAAILDVPGESCPPVVFTAPGAGNGDGDLGDDGGDGDPADDATDDGNAPDHEGGGPLSGIANFFRRLVPAPSPLALVAAVALVALAARTLARRR